MTDSSPLLSPADWTFPVPIAYGPGRIAELGLRCQQLGSSRPLIVTDRGSVTGRHGTLPFVNQAVDALGSVGIEATVFAEVSPNPTNVDVDGGCEVFRSGSHDCVIALGGGSGMDAGKAISLMARNERTLFEFDYDRGQSPELSQSELVPFITVPTTAGTGAETESTAMVTDLDRQVKVCVWHPLQKPAVAILDPELTVGLPPNLTAWTGVDALVHAIEAYSVPDLHPLCDGLALQAMRLIGTSLPSAVADGTNLEARSRMLIGSCLAGISFLKGLGLVHAMSHMVGAVYDTHHGLTNAVLLPAVLRFNRKHIETKAVPMAQALGVAQTDFDGFYRHIVELLDQLGIPSNLTEIGVGNDRIDELATKSISDAAAGTNPRPASQADIVAVLTDAMTSTR